MSRYDAFKERMSVFGNGIKESKYNASKHLYDCTFKDDLSYVVDGMKSVQDEDITIYPKMYNKKIKNSTVPQWFLQTQYDTRLYLGEQYKLKDGSIWQISDVENKQDINYVYTVYRSNCILTTQDKDGQIFDTRCVSFDATKYSSGIKEGNIVTVMSTQFILEVPINSETMLWNYGKRFLIDDRRYSDKFYEETGTVGAFEITQRNVTDRDYSDHSNKGILVLTMTKCEFDANRDNVEYMVADYFEPHSSASEMKIVNLNGSSAIKEMKIASKRSLKLQFKDDIAPLSPIVWEIKALPNVIPYITLEKKPDNTVRISILNQSSIVGDYFVLSAKTEDETLSDEITILINGVI